LNFFSRDEAINFFSQKIGKNLAGKYIIGSIGRLDYAKNYEFLIKVFPKILEIRPDAAAVIMGEGSERPFYESLIRQNGLGEKIFLLGNVDSGSRYLRGFDLLVLPSRYEGLAISLIEGLFSGLPMLATRVGGNAEVAGSDAEIYNLDNAAEFIQKFQGLQDVDILDRVLRNNKAQAEKFNLRHTADGYEQIYTNKR
jgi:glycosyltransferase involved in cell wall biosynthesis